MKIGIVSWNPQFCYRRIELSYRQYEKYWRLRDWHSMTEAAEYALEVGVVCNPNVQLTAKAARRPTTRGGLDQ